MTTRLTAQLHSFVGELLGEITETHIYKHILTDSCNLNQDIHFCFITPEILKEFSPRATLGN